MPRVSLNQAFSTAIFVTVQPPQESKLNGKLQGYNVMWQPVGQSERRESVIGPNITVSVWQVYLKWVQVWLALVVMYLVLVQMSLPLMQMHSSTCVLCFSITLMKSMIWEWMFLDSGNIFESVEWKISRIFGRISLPSSRDRKYDNKKGIQAIRFWVICHMWHY